jgi:hypothetical protein
MKPYLKYPSGQSGALLASGQANSAWVAPQFCRYWLVFIGLKVTLGE